MSDIELVIKIPKRVYNYIRKYEHIAKSDLSDIKDAIINGTLLPKRHGDLFDYYDAIELINNKADEENSNITIGDIEKFGALLREVNPIIEADKAESEDKTE